MFSTRSPTLTRRNATTPSIGARMNDFARRASAGANLRERRGGSRRRRVAREPRLVERLRRNQSVALQFERTIVLAPRARLDDPRLRRHRLQGLDGGVGFAGVEPRQRRPFADRHPLGHVHRGHDAGHLGLHVGGELRRQRPDDVRPFP
jgi:hypothetical protein